MEHTNLSNAGCPNNYQDESVCMERFGGEDKEMDKCNNCPYLYFKDGIITCSKFQKEG